MKKNKIKPLRLKDVTITGSFWNRYLEKIQEKVLPYQWEALNDRIAGAKRSHCIENFEIAFGKKQVAFYGIRHTFCTNKANAGMNPKALQYLMGHASIAMTLNYYAHAIFEPTKAEMDRLAA